MTDAELKDQVEEALAWEPSIDAAHIGVSVHHGIVSLTGFVEHFGHKVSAEEAVKRIAGVRGIAQEIEVRYVGITGGADDEIARRVADTIDWNVFVPKNNVHVSVSNGYVTLTGSVEWNYQRTKAERMAANLLGVTGVDNLLEVKFRPAPDDVKQCIEKAIARNAKSDIKRIQVNIDDGVVTLEGNVADLHERELAEDAAWSAPGVRAVVDKLLLPHK